MPQWVTGNTSGFRSPITAIYCYKIELVFDAHFKFQWGEYVESNKYPDVNNINRYRTYPGIYLVPTGNI